MNDLIYPTDLAIERQQAQTYAEIMTVRFKAKTYAELSRNIWYMREYVNPFLAERLRCERAAGLILLTMDKNKGVVLGGWCHQPPGNEPTYEELGIHKWEAYQQQALARIPEDIFEAWLGDCISANIDITLAGALRYAQQYGVAGDENNTDPDDPHYREIKPRCCATCQHLVCDRRVDRNYMMCSLNPTIRYYEPASEHGTSEDSWTHICDRYEGEE